MSLKKWKWGFFSFFVLDIYNNAKRKHIEKEEEEEEIDGKSWRKKKGEKHMENFWKCKGEKPLTVPWIIVDDDVLGMFARSMFVVVAAVVVVVVVLFAPAWNHVVTPTLLNWHEFTSPEKQRRNVHQKMSVETRKPQNFHFFLSLLFVELHMKFVTVSSTKKACLCVFVWVEGALFSICFIWIQIRSCRFSSRIRNY